MKNLNAQIANQFESDSATFLKAYRVLCEEKDYFEKRCKQKEEVIDGMVIVFNDKEGVIEEQRLKIADLKDEIDALQERWE